MRISTRGEYGLRTLLDLAQHGGRDPIPLRQIAARQEVSEHYLEQLMGVLRKAGFVTSVRGAQGGYRLAMPPEQMTVGDVLRALEGDVEIRVDDGGPLGTDARCVPKYGTRFLWRELNRRIVELLDSMTVAELLVHAEREWAQRSEYVYYI